RRTRDDSGARRRPQVLPVLGKRAKGDGEGHQRRKNFAPDFVTRDRSFTRFFRVGAYPPLRGTFVNLDDERSILYTKGSVDLFKLYPGLYVPETLSIRTQACDQTARQIAVEILALRK